MRRIRVCQHCTERYLGCHDHCEKYKEASEKATELIQTIRRNSSADHDLMNYYQQDKERRRRKKGK